MERFEEVLAVGGHRNSLGRAGEVLEAVRADASRTDELVACIGADDAWVRMRAVDTFEKLVREEPARGQPYVALVLDDLTRSDQPSVQWHVAQLLALLDLTPHEQARALGWLTARIATTEVDWIVAAQSMATLVHLVRRGVVRAAEVEPLLRVQLEHRSASVRRKAARFLADLGLPT